MAPLIGAALIGAASSIGGGLLGSGSARREAERNREFQRKMFGTRYQMTVRDLRKAGLNPMLAYEQGPGSAPSGNMADVSAAGRGVASAGAVIMDYMQRKAEIELMESQAEKAKEEARGTAADADVKESTRDILVPTLEIRGPTGKVISSPSVLRQQIMAGIESTLSGAEEKRASAMLHGATARATDAQIRRIENLIRNENLGDLQRELIRGGFALGRDAAAIARFLVGARGGRAANGLPRTVPRPVPGRGMPDPRSDADMERMYER